MFAADLKAMSLPRALVLELNLAHACRTEAMIKSGKVPDVSMRRCQSNYKKALEKGVLKILSKMGISLLSCYHGAQIFEIYGLGKEVVDFAFKGSVSRIGGMSVGDLQKEAESFWIKVRAPPRIFLHLVMCLNVSTCGIVGVGARE